MKKYLYLALATLAVLVSCKKESPAPAKVDTETGTTTTTEAPMPIQFASNLNQAISTKSYIGVRDKWHNDQKLYIYGIAREGLSSNATEEKPLDFTETAGSDGKYGVLINNVLAEPLTDDANFDVSKISDEQKIHVLRVVQTDPEVKENYYYEEDRRYEFFGYYVDDAAVDPENANTVNDTPKPTIGANDITLGVQIDGSQDIMLAKTDHDAALNADMTNPNRLYSAYSARKGVVPNLVFEHMLSRFNVYVKSGDDTAAEAAAVTLTTAAVETNNTGTLFIAEKDHYGKPNRLDVTEKEPSSIDLATSVVTPPSGAAQPFLPIWQDDAATMATAADNFKKKLLYDQAGTQTDRYTKTMSLDWQKAGTILVMPGKTEYMLKIGIIQTQVGQGIEEKITYYPINFENIKQPKDDAKEAYENDPDVELDAKAEAGHQYDVNVIIYGLQKVEITVTMTKWAQNGSFNLDPDKDFEYKISLGEADAYTKAAPKAMAVGATYQIPVTVTPATGTQYLTYKVNNPADKTVATVSETGLITAVAAHSAPVRVDVIIPNYHLDTTTNQYVGDPKRPEGGYTTMWVKVNEAAPAANQYTVEATNIAREINNAAGLDLSTLITIKEGETVVTPDVTFTLGGATPYEFASIVGSTLTLTAGAQVNDVIAIHYAIPADAVNNYEAKEGDFNVTVIPDPAPAPSQYTVEDTNIDRYINNAAGLDLSTLITIKEGETVVTPDVTFTLGGATPYEFASITGSTLTLTAGAQVDDVIAIHYEIAADAVNNYEAKEGDFNVTVIADPAPAPSQYAVEDTNIAREINNAAGLDLSTLITIKEGETVVNPDVTFTLGGATPYEFASITGSTLTLTAGAQVNDVIAIHYAIPADAVNNYEAKEGDFDVTVIAD